MIAWHVRSHVLSLERPVVMGILNVTPDSFSDGGQFLSPDAAVARGIALLDEGANIIDVGGESTRPHNDGPVPVEEELRRIIPVLRGLASARPNALLSVDTVKSEVASAAISAGAHIVNDVSAMRLDPRMAAVCAESEVGVVLMHSRGEVADMASYAHARYGDDPVNDVLTELGASIQAARTRGVQLERIAIDPGVGFAKRPEHSLLMLAELERFAALGFPVMVGASRKRFVGGAIAQRVTPSERVFGSVGAAVAAFDRGARVFRVHDVAATCAALDVAAAIRSARP